MLRRLCSSTGSRSTRGHEQSKSHARCPHGAKPQREGSRQSKSHSTSRAISTLEVLWLCTAWTRLAGLPLVGKTRKAKEKFKDPGISAATDVCTSKSMWWSVHFLRPYIQACVKAFSSGFVRLIELTWAAPQLHVRSPCHAVVELSVTATSEVNVGFSEGSASMPVRVLSWVCPCHAFAHQSKHVDTI